MVGHNTNILTAKLTTSCCLKPYLYHMVRTYFYIIRHYLRVKRQHSNCILRLYIGGAFIILLHLLYLPRVDQIEKLFRRLLYYRLIQSQNAEKNISVKLFVLTIIIRFYCQLAQRRQPY